MAAPLHSNVKRPHAAELTGRRDNGVASYACDSRSVEVYPLARLKAEAFIVLQQFVSSTDGGTACLTNKLCLVKKN